ncbi:hypothetical protein, partial [Haliscomenobacter sp.]|uniref:hypothetical protein n=1 Tax=Haliscomenobacter sp. TaxID=2717303 RepID=UPI003364DDFE
MNHLPIFTRLLLFSLLCLMATTFAKAQSCQRYSFIYITGNNNICVGDGVPDVVRFFTNAKGSYVYVTTDEKGLVLTSITNGNSFDFEKAGVGICRVYGVSLGAGDQLRGDIIGKAVRATQLSCINSVKVDSKKRSKVNS